MSIECYPMTVLPGVSPLFRDYLAMGVESPLHNWYGAAPFSMGWMDPAPRRDHSDALADLLEQQNRAFGAGVAASENIRKLRAGARAVVTGQQVVLFGGPLLTLLKAATAIARAKTATTATGVEHVPVFWMATEDHDLAEVDQVALLTKTSIETLHAGLQSNSAPVGGVVPGPELDTVLERTAELLGHAPVSEWLRECYRSTSGEQATLALAFGRLMARIFSEQGLVIMDASTREFHALGAKTLRYAIEHAEDLQQVLIARSDQLVLAGYHAQVLVTEGSSLLFLINEATGERQALKRQSDAPPEAAWKANGRTYSTAELLAILDTAPERISPNALLRPVFQDTILPTTAYVGGPAEVAYFAQSSAVYQAILGRVTPILPRLSATLIEPAVAAVMDKDEVALPAAFTTADELAQQLGERAMPVEAKRRIEAAGDAFDRELTALTDYLKAVDTALGQSAEASGSKMLYQMNRLRRMASTFELQKNASLRKHADTLTLNLFPDGHPQERVIAGVWFMARYGDGLVERLVEVAANQCPSHVAVRL
ncbi:bacillithiol biosynthesis cysteine-adding enzyme BshC [Edaphobacter sp.]|uniref:bacillithiol biosynthesis cysteine-adding enzyme BshC n=1 Tax=Edaphobacter sp. TaxID=1934404 RepID=UPI002DBC678A|nr:bacillithiol biosynthesis cysteine-adding enzyme BshC [Edaphobacter sp.]HEU5341222.1 bacillithiol biosynthesis cysteine-adding enzyme BshC [Edaphobacter sp.]